MAQRHVRQLKQKTHIQSFLRAVSSAHVRRRSMVLAKSENGSKCGGEKDVVALSLAPVTRHFLVPVALHFLLVVIVISHTIRIPITTFDTTTTGTGASGSTTRTTAGTTHGTATGTTATPGTTTTGTANTGATGGTTTTVNSTAITSITSTTTSITTGTARATGSSAGIVIFAIAARCWREIKRHQIAIHAEIGLQEYHKYHQVQRARVLLLLKILIKNNRKRKEEK